MRFARSPFVLSMLRAASASLARCCQSCANATLCSAGGVLTPSSGIESSSSNVVSMLIIKHCFQLTVAITYMCISMKGNMLMEHHCVMREARVL